jgi:hypothetical protein
MNPETQYPELKDMKLTEVFIEWAIMVEDFNVVRKIHVRRIIPKKEQNMLIKALKQEYNFKDKPDEFEVCPIPKTDLSIDSITKFRRINLITIEK